MLCFFPCSVSQADCYVSLWLPTAAIEKCRTKTIRNSNDPVWNETFYFRIQSKVKVRNQICLPEDVWVWWVLLPVLSQDEFLETFNDSV